MHQKKMSFKGSCLLLSFSVFFTSLNFSPSNLYAGSPLDLFDFQQSQYTNNNGVSVDQRQNRTAGSEAVPSGGIGAEVRPLAPPTTPTASVTLPFQFNTGTVTENPGLLRFLSNNAILLSGINVTVPSQSGSAGSAELTMNVYEVGASGSSLKATQTKSLPPGNSYNQYFTFYGLTANASIYYELQVSQKDGAGNKIYSNSLISANYTLTQGQYVRPTDQSLSLYADNGRAVFSGSTMTIEGLSIRGTGTAKLGGTIVTVDLYKGDMKIGTRSVKASQDGVLSPVSFGNIEASKDYYWKISASKSGNTVPQESRAYYMSAVLTAPAPPLVINNAPLPAAKVGEHYEFIFNPQGGVAPYTWSFAITDPAYTQKVNELTQKSREIIALLTAYGVQHPLDTNGNPNPRYNPSYDVNGDHLITAFDSLNLNNQITLLPNTWLADRGFIFNTVTGKLEGTPTKAEAINMTISVKDSKNTQVSKAVVLTINPAVILPLVAATTPLPEGRVGVAYNFPINVSGGTVPYTFTVTSGQIPAGLTLSPAGVISGTPTQVINPQRPITITVRDLNAQQVAVNLNFLIQPPLLTVPAVTLPSVRVGESYSFQLTSTGGGGQITWSVENGNLPPGLSLNINGLISGMPTQIGTFDHLEFGATDAYNQLAKNDDLTLRVDAPVLTLKPVTAPQGTAGTNYSLQLTASGGSEPYAWGISQGNTLPAGLTIIPNTGLISGTPTAAGTRSVQVYVVSADGQNKNLTLNFDIRVPSLVIQAASVPEGKVHVFYDFTPTVTGQQPNETLTWSIESGALPQGMNFTPATGRIWGNFRTAGTINLVLRVQGTNGRFGTLPIVINVQPPSLVLENPTASIGQGLRVNYLPQITGAPGGQNIMSLSQEDIDRLEAVGIGFNPNTGRFAGTALVPGTYVVTLHAENTLVGLPTTFQVSITINPASQLSVSLPYPPGPVPLVPFTARVGDPLIKQYEVWPGIGPFTWSISDADRAALAAQNLTFTDGLLSGTPVTAVTALSFTAHVTDQWGTTGSLPITFEIKPPVPINLTLPDAPRGVPYTGSLVEPTDPSGVTYVEDGSWSGSTVGAYSMSYVGIYINPNGSITGNPTAGGVYDFRILMMKYNNFGNPVVAGTKIVRLTVTAPATAPRISTTTLPPANETQATYQSYFTTTGGKPPYTFKVIEGQARLASYGFSVHSMRDIYAANAVGGVAGIPARPGVVSFTVEVTDALGVKSTQEVTLEVIGRRDLRLLDEANITAQVGDYFTLQLGKAQGGDPATYQRSIYGGDLVDGSSLEEYGISVVGPLPGPYPLGNQLQLVSQITGQSQIQRLTKAGVIKFIVRVQDNNGNVAERMVTLTILPDPDDKTVGAEITLLTRELPEHKNTWDGYLVPFLTLDHDKYGSPLPNETTKTWIVYGLAPDALTSFTNKTGFANDHQIRITGLEPVTKYYAKVIARNEAGIETESDIFEFTTQDVPTVDVPQVGRIANSFTLRGESGTMETDERFFTFLPTANDDYVVPGSYVKIVTNAAHGRTRVDRGSTAGVSVVYIPEKGFTGSDSFTYQICSYNNGGGESCSTETARADIRVVQTAKPTITYLPNLSHFEDGGGLVAFRLDYNGADPNLYRNARITGQGVIESQLVGGGGNIIGGGPGVFAHGVANAFKGEGIYYASFGRPGGINDHWANSPDDNFHVNLSIYFFDERDRIIHSDTFFAESQSGLEEKLVVQLMSENIFANTDGTGYLHFNMRGKTATVNTVHFDSWAVGGYKRVTLPAGSFTPGQVNQLFSLGGNPAGRADGLNNKFVAEHFFYFVKNFTFTPTLVAARITDFPSNITNTGIGALFQTSVAGLPPGGANVTLNIYQYATSTTPIHSITVFVAQDGPFTYFIPTTANNALLYGRTFYYELKILGPGQQTVLGQYPPPGTPRPSLSITRSAAVSGTATGYGWRPNNTPQIQFQGTIPGYQENRIGPGGTPRYTAYIALIKDGITVAFRSVNVSADNSFNQSILYGYGAYPLLGITAQLVILPAGLNFSLQDLSDPLRANIIYAQAHSRTYIPLSNINFR